MFPISPAPLLGENSLIAICTNRNVAGSYRRASA